MTASTTGRPGRVLRGLGARLRATRVHNHTFMHTPFKVRVGSGRTFKCPAHPVGGGIREMGGAPRNPAPRNHFLVWIVKPSGWHCTDGHLTSRVFTEESKISYRVPTPLRSTSPFSEGGRSLQPRRRGDPGGGEPRHGATRGQHRRRRGAAGRGEGRGCEVSWAGPEPSRLSARGSGSNKRVDPAANTYGRM